MYKIRGVLEYAGIMRVRSLEMGEQKGIAMMAASLGGRISFEVQNSPGELMRGVLGDRSAPRDKCVGEARVHIQSSLRSKELR